jgi:hypothetical protein
MWSDQDRAEELLVTLRITGWGLSVTGDVCVCVCVNLDSIALGLSHDRPIKTLGGLPAN